jgi:cell division protein FtsI/penicillin-binding protein 2
MRKRAYRPLNLLNRPGWRDYQNRQRQAGAAGRKWGSRLRLSGAAVLAMAALFLLNGLWQDSTIREPRGAAQASLLSRPLGGPVGKQALRRLLDRQMVGDLPAKTFALPVDQQVLQVETSLDEDLQNYLFDRMDRKNSRYIGIVVMEADTGRVLALVGFDKSDPDDNPCLRSEFPAASVFKIVTAASAVDACDFTADSQLRFNGYKHTLYKRQLQDRVNRYTNTVSFKDAFAQSINPVFGKIGQHRLGKPLLAEAAEAFGFNEPLDFELPLDPSNFHIGDQPYNWAEVASGFNRETTMSPLHGAVMAAAVLNGGSMVTPSLVEQVVDPEGKILYSRQPPAKHAAMSPKASTVLSQLMETTISSGTGRQAFRGYQRDKILSRLEIGGKTGSIDNRTHEVRYDWFVGFARERQGHGRLAVAVLVAHEKFIGIRAGQYARMAISHYFRNHPVVIETAQNRPKG